MESKPKPRIVDRQYIKDALEVANIYDWDIRTDYSGRGMYGTECFGIEVDRESDLYRLFAALGHISGENSVDDEGWDEDCALDLARDAQSDSMGRQIIVYFPGYQLSEDA